MLGSGRIWRPSSRALARGSFDGLSRLLSNGDQLLGFDSTVILNNGSLTANPEDLVFYDGMEYHINLPWTPAITRTLRQRHFLHNRG